MHLLLRFGFRSTSDDYQIPLLVTLILGGVPLLYDLTRKLLQRDFGSDLQIAGQDQLPPIAGRIECLVVGQHLR